MSVTVEYLFNADTNLSEFTVAMNRVLGCSFSPYQGDAADQFCRFFGMEFSLHEADGLVCDGDANFDEYKFLLSTRTPVPDGDLRPIQVEVMAIAAYTLYRRLGICQGMLTFDLQTVLARYDCVDGEWTDLISGRSICFPEHLNDLKSRVPSGREDFFEL